MDEEKDKEKVIVEKEFKETHERTEHVMTPSGEPPSGGRPWWLVVIVLAVAAVALYVVGNYGLARISRRDVAKSVTPASPVPSEEKKEEPSQEVREQESPLPMPPPPPSARATPPSPPPVPPAEEAQPSVTEQPEFACSGDLDSSLEQVLLNKTWEFDGGRSKTKFSKVQRNGQIRWHINPVFLKIPAVEVGDGSWQGCGQILWLPCAHDKSRACYRIAFKSDAAGKPFASLSVGKYPNGIKASEIAAVP